MTKEVGVNDGRFLARNDRHVVAGRRLISRCAFGGRKPFARPGALPESSILLKIKQDGFRIIARKDGERVRLYSRPGNDFTHRFPLIVETLARLRSPSCWFAQ